MAGGAIQGSASLRQLAGGHHQKLKRQSLSLPSKFSQQNELLSTCRNPTIGCGDSTTTATKLRTVDSWRSRRSCGLSKSAAPVRRRGEPPVELLISVEGGTNVPLLTYLDESEGLTLGLADATLHRF